MAANENERFDQFAAVLTTELLERTRKNMELLAPEQQPRSRLPFIQTPSFVEFYADLVRVGILPVVLSRRPVRSIVGDVDWRREGREYLLTVLDDRSNAVFTAWDYAWDSLWDERKVGADSAASNAAKPKKGFLSALFGRRNAAKPETKPAGEGEGGVMAGLHSMLTELGERRGFLPLFHEDVRILKGMPRVKPGRLAQAWKEISQYHHQEFYMDEKEQAKPGVTSDCLQKWHYNLPDKIGEFLVIKAAVDLEHVNKPFIGKYIRQSARTQEEAEKGMPYLSIYWKAMSNPAIVHQQHSL
ncbi:hypothetical protein [Azospirillum doebereinerae]|uniref:Uncharacterized protein n=1 Tax=Azospirillum doebereinerae TaxID=92933 RepID=A0A3S0WUY4_9PROT|nr:hypothetical protein [Azospirillum doebereinerae]MCG5242869.1 hypothetical protein [Azospirillum doebereinerae]RUQ70825.1 hypothetical protein EJ913_13780 [Azospirillum doebereinerae]